MGRTVRSQLLLAFVALPCLSQEPAEVMHAAMGMVSPAGASSQRMELAWMLSLGNTLWLDATFGLRFNLEYHNFGLTHQLIKELGAPSDSYGDMSALVFNGLWKLHPSSNTGAYVIFGGGAYQRRLYFTQTNAEPIAKNEPWTGLSTGEILPERLTTTRMGLNAGLGWETPSRNGSTFFVELSFVRIFTQGQAMDMVPLVVGTRF